VQVVRPVCAMQTAGHYSPWYWQHRTRPCIKRKDGAPTVSKWEEKNRLERASHPPAATCARVGHPSTTSNYTYDQLYELTQVTQGASTTESYSYDSVGNRLSSSGVPNYNYNVSNELTSNSTGSYAYDNNGNTLTDASGKSYMWDFENRMVQAAVPGSNGGTVTFKYDPFGRRIEKSSWLGTTNYLYDGINVLETSDQNGNELARYADTLNVDEPLSELVSGTTSFYAQDGLASVTSLTNGSGAAAGTYTYDSFGNLTASTGTVRNYFQYTGREFDPETGTYEYRLRYYDPNVGRFISEDPIGVAGGLNTYSYVRNRVTVLSDPFGLCPAQPSKPKQPCYSGNSFTDRAVRFEIL